MNIFKRIKSDDFIEKRKLDRLKTPLNVNFKIINGRNNSLKSNTINGITKNISTKGICLETDIVQINGFHISHDISMQFKNLVDMEIDISTEKNIPITAIGSVSWYNLAANDSSRYKYEVGIVFSDIDEENVKRLTLFLNEKNKS